MEIGIMIKEKVKEQWNNHLGWYMKVVGKKINMKDKVYWEIKMVKNSKASLWKINVKVKEFFLVRAHIMKENGKIMIYQMVF